MKKMHAGFLVLCLATGAVFRTPITAIFSLSLHDERYTHILLIPFIVVALLWLDRRRIIARAERSGAPGASVILVGYLILETARSRPFSVANLWLSGLALVLTIYGSLLACYGMRSFRAACFPLLFLLWIIPIPPFILDKVVSELRAGSTELSYLLFRLSGVPVLKHGFTLSLPGIDIDVAPQCSGIRSGISFLIAGLLMAHSILRSTWRQLCLVACILPIVMLKNAVRIVSISSLGLYIDRGFLSGNLHRYGGLPFSLVGLAFLLPLAWLLWKSEGYPVGTATRPAVLKKY